jgi:hypothetical protein
MSEGEYYRTFECATRPERVDFSATHLFNGRAIQLFSYSELQFLGNPYLHCPSISQQIV